MTNGVTLLALPYVSKTGFSGATMSSVVLSAFSGGMKRVKVLFLGDHSQIHARNASAQSACDDDCEYLWFVDSDMDFPANTLERLKACDADIACTDMWSRNIPSFRTVMRLREEDGKQQFAAVDIPPIKKPIEEPNVQDVDACGMACTLIRVSLLKKFLEADHLWYEGSIHGEDVSFCIRAKQAFGATIKCDFGLMAGHWGQARMAGQDWTRDANNQMGKISMMDMMARMGVRNLPQEGVK